MAANPHFESNINGANEPVEGAVNFFEMPESEAEKTPEVDKKMVHEVENTTFHSDFHSDPHNTNEISIHSNSDSNITSNGDSNANLKDTSNNDLSNGATSPLLKVPALDKKGQEGYTPPPQAKPLYKVPAGTNVYVAPGANNHVPGSPVFIERGATLIDIKTDQKINHDLPPNTLIDVVNGTPILLWDGTRATDSKTGLPAVVTADVFAYEMPTKQQLTAHYTPNTNYNSNTNQNTGIDWLDYWFGCSYVDHCHRCSRHGCHGYCGYYHSRHYHNYYDWHHHHNHHHYGHHSLVSIVIGDSHHHGNAHMGYGNNHHPQSNYRQQQARQEAECLTSCCNGIYNCFKDIFCGLYKGAKCCCGNCWECATSKDGCVDTSVKLCGECGKACCSCLGKAPGVISDCFSGCLDLAGKLCNFCGNTCCTCVGKIPECLEATVKLCGQCGSNCCDYFGKCVQAAPDCRMEDAGYKACCSICGAIGKGCVCLCDGLSKLKL